MAFFLAFFLSQTAPVIANLTIVDIYDGDTFFITIPDCDPLLCEKLGVRVRGIDTPEIRGKCEKEKQLARQAKLATEQFLHGGLVELKRVERGKYYRLVADVEVDGGLLSDHLINLGLARPYDGGHRAGWCDEQ